MFLFNKKNIVFFLCIFIFCVLGCGIGTNSSSYRKAEKNQIEIDRQKRENATKNYILLKQDLEAQQKALSDFISNLSEIQKLSQLFLVNLEGKENFKPVEYSSEGIPLIPGGYIFFSYNIAETPEKLAKFNYSIQKFSLENKIIPPFLSVDQEGGLVNRLRNINSMLPSAQLISQRLTPEQAFAFYENQAGQMFYEGFHINLAPVAEVSDELNSNFLGNRSYGNENAVIKYASAAVNGFQKQGIGAVLKHFPGNTNDDPHTGLPEINVSAEKLEELYLKPFQKLLQTKPLGVLMSHARTSAFDKNTPACLSSFWVTDILRNKYNYEGLIFSDDIFMAALEKNGFPPEKAIVMAIEAGVDVIMLSEKRFASSIDILSKKLSSDKNFAILIEKAIARIINAKIKYGILERNYDSSTKTYSIKPKEVSSWNEDKFLEFKEKGQSLYNNFFTIKN